MRERERDCAFVRLPEALDDELIAYPLVAVRTMLVAFISHIRSTAHV